MTYKAHITGLLFFSLCLFLSGCDSFNKEPAKPVTTLPKETMEYQRFVPNGSIGFALDTKTGQACRTFPPSTAKTAWDNLPLCVDLYKTSVTVADRQADPRCAPEKIKTAEEYAWCRGLDPATWKNPYK
jgi:hypothetical protein